jgi:16S rRNA (guanine527-N7)-methyltransferase
MRLLTKYFPDLTETQLDRFNQLPSLYEEWNAQINVISRKDMDQFEVHHVLHSLAIAKYVEFEEGDQVLDLGTGGGFPGVPLAIMYPAAKFHLVDGTGKKIKVVNAVIEALGLQNVIAEQVRAEELEGPYTHVVTRATAPLHQLQQWTWELAPEGLLICLKGGDLDAEIKESGLKVAREKISDVFEESYFETKQVVTARL